MIAQFSLKKSFQATLQVRETYRESRRLSNLRSQSKHLGRTGKLKFLELNIHKEKGTKKDNSGIFIGFPSSVQWIH